MSEKNQLFALLPVHSEPMVSIGLPTYNRPAGLRKALEWILQQTYPNLEILVSDNCSTNTEVQKITTEFAARDNRIRVFRQNENIGLENNFNYVYAQSLAPYFIWMSDDDFFDANYISDCVQFLEKNPDFVLCSGVAKYYSDDEYLFSEPMFRLDQQGFFARLFKYFYSVEKNGNFYGVFRNNLLDAAPLGVHAGCDWSFMGKMAMLGKLTYIESTSYHRSADGNSQTRQKMIEKFKLRGLKSLFFESYLAYSVAFNLFKDNAIRKIPCWTKQKILVIIIFAQINWRLLYKFIIKSTKRWWS